jgi:long-subunit fatty acid transport protein
MIRSLKMPRLVAGTALAALAVPGSAYAGALEQVVPNTIRLLYEEGRYLEFGATYVEPEQRGEGVTIPPNNGGAPTGFFPGSTGQIFDSDWSFGGAYKAYLNDRISYAIGFDQTFAGHTTYGTGTFPLPVYQGTSADMETWQVTAALSYDVNSNVKIYGGVRAQRFDATVDVSFPSYSVETDKDWAWGYLVGAAYERPEIALRVALTYFSDISYDLGTEETVTSPAGALTEDTTTDVETPQSVSLDFQTGVAPKTLVFGYIRWVDWSEFDVTPPLFGEATAAVFGQPLPLVSFEGDIWTYSLGVGRQLTDNLAGSFSVIYEPETGDTMPTLAPYDGQVTGIVALSYDIEQFTISGGISYGVLGDAENDLGTDFNDGSVWGAGVRVAYNF